MALDHVLNFLGGDVLSPTPNNVFLAVDKIQKAVSVHPAQVAGVEPAVAKGLDVLFFVAPISGHDGRVVDGYFPHGVDSHMDACHRVGDAHLVLEPGLRMLTGFSRRTSPALLPDAFNGPETGLGHAKANYDVGVEPILEFSQKFWRKRRRAVEQPDGVVFVVGFWFVLGQHGHHHADEVDHRGLGFAHLSPETGRAETVDHHQCPAGSQSAHSRVVLDVGVVVGQAGEEPVICGGLGPVGKALSGGHVHHVGTHHALGVACGAGGVDQHGDIIR